jgi:hypothetical protein
MADSRITELNELLGANLAANDVLPVSDVSASETKKIKAKSLIEGGVALADDAFIDLSKLNQASTTKIGGAAIASGSIDASKLANDSTIAVETTAPSGNNFEGRGFFNSSSGNLQIFSGADYAQVVVPTAGIGDLQVTTGKLADGAVTTTKVTALGTAAYADSSVTTAKIADGSITTAKIAAGAVTASQIAAGSLSGAGLASATVTYDKLQNVSATDRLLGRTSAGAGSVEEISCTAAGRALLDDADAATQRATLGLGTISTGNGTWADGGSFSGTSSGTNTGDQTITLTGDVTGTGTGSFATTIATGAVDEGTIASSAVTTEKINDDAVTSAKLADNSAAIVAASSPAGDGAFIGQQWFNTNNGQEFTWTGTAWTQQAGIGTINIVDSTPIAIEVSYPDAYSATLTTTLDTQVAATVFAGPETGADTAPTFRAIVPGDLPDATVSTKGIIQPGTGLAVDAGTLNHTNTVSGTTISSITFDNQGHITAAVPLVAADIPVLDASKITTGTFPTAFIADESITGLKIADYANAQIGETLPVADHIGQFFFNPLEGSVYLWDGNVWQPVGVTTGAIAFAGTFDASTPSGVGQVGSVTAAGAAVGLIAGSGLPAASLENSEYYLVVASGGTITTGNAPFRTLAPPDLILSDGTAWVEVDVSAGAGAVAASNVAFSAGGDIGSTNVQGAIEEVSTECRNADNITSGTLAVARGGTGLASYTKGDLIAASGSTTLAKLPVGTNTHVLRANSSTATGLEWGADFTGTVTTVSSATAALTVATATTTPALTLRSATTSVNGIVQLSDSTSTTSSILAATPTAVKAAYDLAALALPKAGGTVTGDITLGTNVGIQFEGTTDDDNEIRLIGADATADRTITLPNVTGTVITTGDSGTVTSTMIANDTIVNADINASAAIALSKLATGALPSGITVASANIVDGTIVNDDISASAAIADTKLDTISTAGKVSNSATTADSANTASAIVARDASGNFAAGDITISDKIIHAGDTDTAIRFPAADTVTVETDGSEKVRITSVGNLLVGTTGAVSVNGLTAGLELHALATTNGASASIARFADDTVGPQLNFGKSRSDTLSPGTVVQDGDILGEISFCGDDGTDITSRAARIACEIDGTPGADDMPGRLIFSTTADGASFPTERMRIDSSGRLLVGTTTARSNFGAGGTPSIQNEGTTANGSQIGIVRNENAGTGPAIILGKTRATSVGGTTVVNSDDNLGFLIFEGADGTNLIRAAQIEGEVDGTPGANDMPGRLVFSTTADGASTPTERMRITSTGRVTEFATNDNCLLLASNSGAGTTFALIYGTHTATAVNTGTVSFAVFTNGNVQNTNNSYGAYSDLKLKENIVDAASQWSDIKALQVRKYNFKEEIGHQTHTQIGLIAQEVELVSPGLVSESPDRDEDGNDLGTVTKSVNYSVLYMKAVKALQEAMERIEALEARITALEA